MKNYLFIALATITLTTSCSLVNKSSSSATDKPLEGIEWKLVEVKEQVVPEGLMKEPNITLRSAGKRVYGNGGCNGMGGTYQLKGKSGIKFSKMSSTMMACPNMEVEANLIEALGNADKYVIKGDTLTIMKGKGAPLAKFVAKAL
ncbi:MAG: META domain-containing protein [Niabella sp.]